MPVFDLMDKDGLHNYLTNWIRSNMRFYDGGPEKGGKRITFHEHLDSMSVSYIPTSDAERLQATQQAHFEEDLKNFIERRKWNAGLETTQSDMKAFRKYWLTEELQRIEHWQNRNPQDRPEVLLELKKYENFVKNELSMLEVPGEWQPLPTLEEYLKLLNRTLSELPNKLNKLFPQIDILNGIRLSHTDRLPVEQYKATVHLYEQLKFDFDIHVLQSIRLDPDFNFFHKRPVS